MVPDHFLHKFRLFQSQIQTDPGVDVDMLYFGIFIRERSSSTVALPSQ